MTWCGIATVHGDGPKVSVTYYNHWSRNWEFFKWANPGLFLIDFRIFKQALQFLQLINVKKCPSSIQCWNLNPKPLGQKSPPITTRPGIPPFSSLSNAIDCKLLSQ